MIKHLEEVEKSYFSHMIGALKISGKMIYGGFACFIHAFCPWWFTNTASNIFHKLSNENTSRLRNMEFVEVKNYAKINKVLLCIIMLGLLGCDKYEYSEIQKDKGVVVSKNYTPSKDETYYITNWISVGEDIRIPIQTAHTRTIPAKYSVTFRCEHNDVFTIDGYDLYNLLENNMDVIIEYKSIYKVRKDHKELYDYDFIKAYPANAEREQ